MSGMALTFSSFGPYAKLFGVIAAIILFGAWLLEKTAVDHATKLRDGIAKAEQDKEVTERTFRIESRLIEVYQVAASARDYSYRCTLKAQPTYIDELKQDVELLERTGVARDLTTAMLGYSSRTNSFLEAINPPAPLRDRVAKATKGVVDFKTQVDQRRDQYNAQQHSLVGQVINPNTITESQASQLSASIRAFRNDIEFSLMPHFEPLANEMFRSYDELFDYARKELEKRERTASALRWIQLGVYIVGSILAIFGSYLEATKSSHPTS